MSAVSRTSTTETQAHPEIRQALAWGESALSKAKIENSRMESAWILASVTGHDSGSPLIPETRNQDILFNPDRPLSAPVWTRYRDLIGKRADGTPLAYLLGTQDFMGIEIRVNMHVLIPRPETEVLVRETITMIKNGNRHPRILDVGTGSGNIAIALARNIPAATVTATDISLDALDLAKENARHYGVEDRIRFIRSQIFENVPDAYDVIISNPPYVREADFQLLQREVLKEPRHALDGGEDGLRVIEPLVRKSLEFLRPEGIICLEVGYDQSGSVTALMLESGFSQVNIIPDGSGIGRVLIGRRNGIAP